MVRTGMGGFLVIHSPKGPRQTLPA
jgi:hypothetical protein